MGINRSAFLIVLMIYITVALVSCGGWRKAETAFSVETELSSAEATPIASECSRLAASGNTVTSWKLASPVAVYDKKTIFDYIDGAAELYFAYDFIAVAAAEYQNGETSIIIDVYDMTSPENAFGIYSLNRYPEAVYADIGNEGILSGASLDFWKGRYFCKVYCFDMSEKYQEDVVNFGRNLALSIQEAGTEPSILSSLPSDGLMPKTAKFFSRKLGLDNIHYVAEDNVLNLSSETKGVVAEYQVDNSDFQLFTIRYPSQNEAYSAFETYSSYLEKKAELLSEKATTRGISKTFKSGDKIIFVGLKGQNLWGLWNVQTPEIAEQILQNILPFPR